MKVCDIVHFSNERCFNGAVQTAVSYTHLWIPIRMK